MLTSKGRGAEFAESRNGGSNREQRLIKAGLQMTDEIEGLDNADMKVGK